MWQIERELPRTTAVSKYSKQNLVYKYNFKTNAMRRPRTEIQDKNERPTTDDWKMLARWGGKTFSIHAKFGVDTVGVCDERALDIFAMTSIHIFHTLAIHSIRIHNISAICVRQTSTVRPTTKITTEQPTTRKKKKTENRKQKSVYGMQNWIV